MTEKLLELSGIENRLINEIELLKSRRETRALQYTIFNNDSENKGIIPTNQIRIIEAMYKDGKSLVVIFFINDSHLDFEMISAETANQFRNDLISILSYSKGKIESANYKLEIVHI